MSILVIDDSDKQRRLLSLFLKKGGFDDIIARASATEAFSHLGLTSSNGHGCEVDLILMDVLMPEMDGFTACRTIKEEERFEDIPIVMVTGMSDQENLEKAFAAGATDYIVKPVKRLELLARVRSLVKLKHEIDARKARERELLEVTQQLRAANRMLQQLSMLDALTGIPNRRYFEEYYSQEWWRAARNADSLSLLMIDIDYFKAYNDTYGHQAGDECLKRVAGALNAVLRRQSDFAARYGGEEFAVILPSTELQGALLLAENMLAEVVNLRIDHAESDVSQWVTISIGVATTTPRPDGTPAVLLAEADHALYEAKQAGRMLVKKRSPE